MKQSEIWYADLNPTIGSEQQGIRPVVILSGNILNTHGPVVIVAPLTTKIKSYKGNPILKPSLQNGLTAECELLMMHIRSISKNRLLRKIGSIDASELALAHRTISEIMRY